MRVCPALRERMTIGQSRSRWVCRQRRHAAADRSAACSVGRQLSRDGLTTALRTRLIQADTERVLRPSQVCRFRPDDGFSVLTRQARARRSLSAFYAVAIGAIRGAVPLDIGPSRQRPNSPNVV